jgi:hypothetical protein
MVCAGWQRKFDDPITLTGGGQLVTLKDAASYVMKLSKASQAREEWQTAIAVLIGAAEGRDFLFHVNAAMLQALNAGKPNAAKTARGSGPRP